jgi:hypothetical protein
MKGYFQRSVGICISCVILFPLFFLLSARESSADSYRDRYNTLVRRYTLYGAVGLSYERDWGDNRGATHLFTQSYSLGFRGFVVDPRLVYFDVAGTFSKSTGNEGQHFSLLGQSLNVTFLQVLPHKWWKYWYVIPNPINVRFLHYSDSVDYTQYGITLRLAKPSELRALESIEESEAANAQSQAQAEMENNEISPNMEKKKKSGGAGFPFPITYFDYDHYDTGSSGSKTVSDYYSLRSQLLGKVYDYQLLVEHMDQRGDAKLTRTTVEFQPNYMFYDQDTRKLLEIQNLFRYQKIDELKTFEVHSRVNLNKPMGADSLFAQGAVDYSHTSAPGVATTTYDASTTATYQKVVSPRLTYSPFVSVGFFKGDDAEGTGTTTHFERAGSGVEYDISKIFRNTSNAFVGTTDNGFEYGAETVFSTKTRISTALGYAFSSLFPEEGRTMTHRLSFSASGPIVSTLSFNTYAYFTKRDVSHTDNAFSDETILYSANLYWFWGRTSASLGGNYSQVTTRNGDKERSYASGIQATLSRVLTRRTFLTVYSLWTQDSLKNKSLEVRPRLRWSTRQTSVEAEYAYRRFSILGSPETTEHRFWISFIRYFSVNLRI